MRSGGLVLSSDPAHLPLDPGSRPCFVFNDVEASVSHVSIENPGHARSDLLCACVRTFAGDLGNGTQVPVFAA